MSKKNDTDNHIEIEKRKSILTDCVLCPRNCHADRINGRRGRCHETAEIVVARAALHMWEEPCISGDAGSGAVFFSGCPMGCVFCQNHNIAEAKAGKTITVERLSEIFLELQEKGGGQYQSRNADALCFADHRSVRSGKKRRSVSSYCLQYERL